MSIPICAHCSENPWLSKLKWQWPRQVAKKLIAAGADNVSADEATSSVVHLQGGMTIFRKPQKAFRCCLHTVDHSVRLLGCLCMLVCGVPRGLQQDKPNLYCKKFT